MISVEVFDAVGRVRSLFTEHDAKACGRAQHGAEGAHPPGLLRACRLVLSGTCSKHLCSGAGEAGGAQKCQGEQQFGAGDALGQQRDCNRQRRRKRNCKQAVE